MKKQRILALILAMLLVALGVTACAPAAQTPPAESKPAESKPAESTPADPVEKTKIVYWHTLSDHHEAALLGLIGEFNASQDLYEVVAEQQPYAEFDAKLMQAVRNGIGPDVCTMFPTNASNYMQDGFLYDMSGFINDPQIGIPNFQSEISEGLYAEITQWGGSEIYLIPATTTGEVLFYNKTMFDALGLTPPTTWTELEACAKAIYNEYGIAGFGTDSVTDTYQCLIKQAGSDYIDPAGKRMVIDRSIGLQKLNWFADAVKAGHFRLVGEDFYFSNPFGSQAVGMYIGSSAGVSYVFAAIPEGDGKFEVGCVPIPQEGPVKYISSWGSYYVCLSPDETRARGTYEFLKFFTSTDVTVRWAEAFGSVPVYASAVATQQFKDFAATNIAVKALSEESKYIGFLASIPGSVTVRTEIDKMVQSVALGVSDAETAFDNFIAAANAALNE